MWQYVNTLDNPADIASRGSEIPELQVSELWWQGPSWLKLNEDSWPKEAIKSMDEEGKIELVKGEFDHLNLSEHLSQTFVTHANPLSIDFARFGTWRKLLNVAKRVFEVLPKLIAAFSKKSDSKLIKTFTLSDTELTVQAESWLFRESQKLSFFGEWEDLKRIRDSHKDAKDKHTKERLSFEKLPFVVSGQSRLTQLRPVMDFNGVIRLNSRVTTAKQLGFDQRYPVILSPEQHLTTLLVRHHHFNILKHVSGHLLTLHNLQSKFWIINGKQACKTIVRKCVVCKLWRKMAIKQVQGPLPEYRIPGKMAAPFAYTIVDAAGPFLIKVKRSQVKRYVIVFACMNTRAIHLELAEDLSMDGFLNCFTRFEARRGLPELIRSDNGGNFKAAAAELRSLFEAWDKSLVEERGYGDIQWIFSVPFAPHTQGSVERIVGLVKQGLHVNIGTEPVREYVLLTVLARLEGILNDRPLTNISTDPEDPRPLCPNDFLRPLRGRESGPLTDDDGSRIKKNFNAARHLMIMNWKFLVEQMVPTLHKNTVPGWDKVQRDVQVNDVVAVLDEQERGHWPLARVTQIVRNASDGRVRFVEIQMARKTGKTGKLAYEPKKYQRNVQRLMLLLPADEFDAPCPSDLQK